MGEKKQRKVLAALLAFCFNNYITPFVNLNVFHIIPCVTSAFGESLKLFSHQENDIIRCTLPCTRYMSLWSLSDKFPSWIQICECMVRIIGHNSLLKADDYHLRGLTMSHKVCEMCDLYMVESIQHIIMQCPGVYKERESMFNQIYENIPSLRNIFSEQPSKVLF